MNFLRVLAASLVIASLVMAAVFVYVASHRELSTLELVTFQVMTLFLSLAGLSSAADSLQMRHPNNRSGGMRSLRSDVSSLSIEG